MDTRIVDALRADVHDRYYRWCLSESTREVENGCSRLRRLRNRQSLGFVELTETWDPTDQKLLLHGLVQRSWGGADDLAAITPRQNELLARWDHGVAHGFGPRDTALSVLFQFEHGEFRLDRKLLRRELKNRLGPVLGTADRRSSSAWRYSTPSDGWTIITELDTGGKTRQFEYEHTITLDGVPIQNRLAPESWFGIAFTSNWNMIMKSEWEEAVAAAAEFTAYFVGAIPALLSGIETRQ